MTDLKPDTFVKAASIVADKGIPGLQFCCHALKSIFGDAELEFFKDVFGPDLNMGDPWWKQSDLLVYDRAVARSIALLLCAEMAKDIKK